MNKIYWFMVPVLMFSGCTWVKLNNKGETVSVVEARYAKACKVVGQITSKVIVDVGGIKRSPNKVARELETLARNDAAQLKGDTLVIGSPIRTVRISKFKKNARRTFKVYRCGAK